MRSLKKLTWTGCGLAIGAVVFLSAPEAAMAAGGRQLASAVGSAIEVVVPSGNNNRESKNKDSRKKASHRDKQRQQDAQRKAAED